MAFILNMVMYAVFSAAIMNYVGTLSCTVIAATTAISLIRAKQGKDRPPKEEADLSGSKDPM